MGVDFAKEHCKQWRGLWLSPKGPRTMLSAKIYQKFLKRGVIWITNSSQILRGTHAHLHNHMNIGSREALGREYRRS